MATIQIRTGTEGPEQASFFEITVHRTSPHFTGAITFHEGMGVWIEVNGRRGDSAAKSPALAELVANLVFEDKAGVSVERAMRAYAERRVRAGLNRETIYDQ